MQGLIDQRPWDEMADDVDEYLDTVLSRYRRRDCAKSGHRIFVLPFTNGKAVCEGCGKGWTIEEIRSSLL